MKGETVSNWKQTILWLVSFTSLCASGPSAAQQNQSVATLASFEQMDGFHYFGPLLQASDGSFYGTICTVVPSPFPPTTYRYGGELFQLAADGTLTTILSFPMFVTENQLGFGPFSGVTPDDDGNLYGTTYVHGATDDTLWGMVYKVTTGGEL